MKTFPMFIKTTGRRIVVVGGGQQAASKLRLLSKTDAQIDVFASHPDPSLSLLFDRDGTTRYAREPNFTDFQNCALAFIATGCPGSNRSLALLAKEAGALTNVVDDPEASMAYTPSIVDRDPLVVAIGTEGAAPILGRRLKIKIEELLDHRIGKLAAFAGSLRSAVALRFDPKERRSFWGWVFDGPAGRRHASGDEKEAYAMVEEALAAGKSPEESHASRLTFLDVGQDADLISIRAVQRLQDAEEIFFYKLPSEDVLEYARRDAHVFSLDNNGAEALVSFEKTIRGIAKSIQNGRKTIIISSIGDANIANVRNNLLGNPAFQGLIEVIECISNQSSDPNFQPRDTHPIALNSAVLW